MDRSREANMSRPRPVRTPGMTAREWERSLRERPLSGIRYDFWNRALEDIEDRCQWCGTAPVEAKCKNCGGWN